MAEIFQKEKPYLDQSNALCWICELPSPHPSKPNVLQRDGVL